MKLFGEYLKEALLIKNKKYKITPIKGYTIEINDNIYHDFSDRITKIKEYIKTLDKNKHKWILQQTDKEFLNNLEERINSGFKKLASTEYIKDNAVAIYFKKSKFIGFYLVKKDYIRLNTIGPFNYSIRNSAITYINENTEILELDE